MKLFVFLFFPWVLALLGQSGRNLEKTKNKNKKFRPMNQVWEEAGQDMALNFLCFFGCLFFCWFFHGFGAVFSSFRIWIVCMRVWDRSKLQEWKQISKQDDFKQTVQDMRISTISTPSPPPHPPFCIFAYIIFMITIIIAITIILTIIITIIATINTIILYHPNWHFHCLCHQATQRSFRVVGADKGAALERKTSKIKGWETACHKKYWMWVKQ